jgi:hypothetical protein
VGAAAPDVGGGVGREGSRAVPEFADQLVDEQSERGGRERGGGGEFPFAVAAWTGEQPEREGGDRDDRHRPLLEQGKVGSEPGVVGDEAVDGVVDAVVDDPSRFLRGCAWWAREGRTRPCGEKFAAPPRFPDDRLEPSADAARRAEVVSNVRARAASDAQSWVAGLTSSVVALAEGLVATWQTILVVLAVVLGCFFGFLAWIDRHPR